MVKFKRIDKVEISSNRRKTICIEDSFMKYIGLFDKKSYILNPRNPLKKDETIIDYEMDSEEEWNELNGEDVEAENKKEEEEDEDEAGEEEESFIVPDSYLSASEMNLT